mmetsp:Transcript_18410/g.57963  ORF Transcript_18410/g.57963 Transcript_18410/m.57963 type:complete len:325 (-) Transcript_18410:218-1192(-)
MSGPERGAECAAGTDGHAGAPTSDARAADEAPGPASAEAGEAHAATSAAAQGPAAVLAAARAAGRAAARSAGPAAPRAREQLEQQDQLLEEHKAVLEELVSGEEAEPSEDAPYDPQPLAQRRGSGESRGSVAVSRQASEVQSVDMASGVSGSAGGLAGSSGDRPNIGLGSGFLQVSLEALGVKGTSPKKAGLLWEKVMDLCSEQRFLEAYKQAIAEPEESCLLKLMRHTGPIVERLDAESNSRLIRRLIHILSSPSKDCAAASIEQIFAWLRQALTSGIHFTASQVEDLAAALQRVALPQSPLPPPARAEASQLLMQVSALRRP